MSILGINADLYRMPIDPETGLPSGKPEPLVATTREDSRGAWSPDGRWVLFDRVKPEGGDIWLVERFE